MKIPTKPLFTAEIDDEEFGYEGWVAIHSLGASGACGGMRLYPDVTKSEVQSLAEAMTYKYAFFGRRTGGAKGGYRLPFDLSPEDRQKALRNLGRHLGPLLRNGIYQPWTDMNCSSDDIKAIYAGAGAPFSGTLVDSSYYTALSTFAGLLAVAEHYEIKSAECKITIEGLGNVGAHLASEIDRWGGKLIGCSTRLGAVVNLDGLNVEKILAARKEHGDAWVKPDGDWDKIDPDEIYDFPMNIHVPCARVHAIDAAKASRLKAKAIVPAANVPCTPDARSALLSRGVELLPDFVINGGGITGSSLAELGGTESDIRNLFVNDFKNMLVRLLAVAAAGKENSFATAALVAATNYPHLVESATATISLHRKIARALQGRGLLPKGNRGKKEAERLLKLINHAFTDVSNV